VFEDPAIALRRLYFAKLETLQRLQWRTHRERQREALDYACSYLPGCRIAPMPRGGLAQLEDDLCLELDIRRCE
jgi:hypothetical protein